MANFNPPSKNFLLIALFIIIYVLTPKSQAKLMKPLKYERRQGNVSTICTTGSAGRCLTTTTSSAVATSTFCETCSSNSNERTITLVVSSYIIVTEYYTSSSSFTGPTIQTYVPPSTVKKIETYTPPPSPT
ncbi:9367_t:CDS:2, partial [Acaulospora morrowiae]